MEQKHEKQLEVEGQHNSIKIPLWDKQAGLRNLHPKAAWFPKAGLGLFLHWGISAVHGEVDLSWGMIAGWELVKQDVCAEQLADMMQRNCYSIEGTEITPSQYFSAAKDFKGEHYNPREWIRLAKQMGATYAVLTTRHHDGFALWPSNYGDFNTKNYCEGRDFVGEYIDACREFGLKVGLYYSPPDWYFNRKHMSYLVYLAKRKYPMLQDLDLDFKPCTLPDEAEMQRQNKRYGEYVQGQLDELLTQYGEIDLLWFDGGMPQGQVYPMERIRALQPGIVVNPRLHGDGDFETCEVKEASQRPNGWWEFCTQWQSKGWAYLKGVPYRSLAVITTEFVRTLAWGGNYLLNVGPMADGSFSPETMRAIEEFTVWHQANQEALCGTVPLSNPALCEVPAVEKNGKIYIFLLPENNGDIVLTALSEHVRAAFLDDGSLCASARTGEGKLVLKTKGKADTRAVRTLEVIL